MPTYVDHGKIKLVMFSVFEDATEDLWNIKNNSYSKVIILLLIRFATGGSTKMS